MNCSVNRRRGRVVIAITFTLVAMTTAVFFLFHRNSRRLATPPAVTLPVERTVTDDDVVRQKGYIGSDSCAGCHRDIVERFSRTAMSSAMAEITASFPKGKTPEKTPGDFTYRNTAPNGPPVVLETLSTDRPLPIEHVLSRTADRGIGAGVHSQAFAYRAGEYLYQLPVEWYSSKGLWDMAPGFDMPEHQRFFRQVSGGCIGCHSAFPTHRPWSTAAVIDPLPRGIDCERCHGPAEQHVAWASGQIPATDTTVSQPHPSQLGMVSLAKLPVLRRLDICAQCHLQGAARVFRKMEDHYSYRPGQPLHDHCVVFLPEQPEPGSLRFVSHVERLVSSRCFQESPGKMTCTSCHDPHETSRGKSRQYWNNKCLACHKLDSCKELPPVRGEAQDDCSSCHMPRRPPFDLQHAEIVDHWIHRRPVPNSVEPESTRRLAVSDKPLTLREHTAWTGETPAPGLDLLLVQAYLEVGDNQHAQQAMKKVTKPAEDPSLYHLLRARLFSTSDAIDDALASYQLTIEADPNMLAAHKEYTLLLRDQQRWQNIPAAAAAWLQVDPLAYQAYEALGGGLFVSGDQTQAKVAFERAIAWGPGSFWSEVGLAAMAMDARRFSDAELHFTRALQLRPLEQSLYESLTLARQLALQPQPQKAAD